MNLTGNRRQFGFRRKLWGRNQWKLLGDRRERNISSLHLSRMRSCWIWKFLCRHDMLIIYWIGDYSDCLRLTNNILGVTLCALPVKILCNPAAALHTKHLSCGRRWTIRILRARCIFPNSVTSLRTFLVLTSRYGLNHDGWRTWGSNMRELLRQDDFIPRVLLLLSLFFLTTCHPLEKATRLIKYTDLIVGSSPLRY